MDQEQLVKVFKALANEGRLKILQAIHDSELQCACQLAEPVDSDDPCCTSAQATAPLSCCVEDIVGQFDIAQSTVSQHLKELHNAGLLDRHKQAQWVYYTINNLR